MEDSTDSDSHRERALCLSSQEGHGGQSTDHDGMDKNPHATAAVVDLQPQTVGLWVPTDLQAIAVLVDLWSQTTWTQPMWTQLHVDPAPVEDSTDSDSHCERALCLLSQEGHGDQSTDHDCMDKTHKIHTLQQPWWIYSHRPWAYGFPQIHRL